MRYPLQPSTLGEHLLKRRMELALRQRDVASRLGASLHAVLDWEKDRKQPELRYWRRIIAFLGYDPCPEPGTLGDRLRARYRQLGIPRKEAARRLRIDVGTLRRYERGIWKPTSARTVQIIERFLAPNNAAFPAP